MDEFYICCITAVVWAIDCCILLNEGGAPLFHSLLQSKIDHYLMSSGFLRLRLPPDLACSDCRLNIKLSWHCFEGPRELDLVRLGRYWFVSFTNFKRIKIGSTHKHKLCQYLLVIFFLDTFHSHVFDIVSIILLQ